jgi:magnesium-transporting ATPase (P-type)
VHHLDTPYKQYVPKNHEINKYLYRLFPKIYFVGQENSIFNYRNFFFWILEGVVEGCIISFFAFYIFSSASLSSSGYNTDLWIASLTM